MDWRQRLEIETPEHVALDYELAGLGSRGLAAILDTVILTLFTLASVIALGLLVPVRGVVVEVLLVLLLFLTLWGYFTFFEAFRDGQTPGKRWMGIRVVHDTGHALTFGGAALRNLLRIADFVPPPYLIGGLMVALHPRAKRLGDLVAGTVVIRDQPQQALAATPAPEPEILGAPLLGDEEFALLKSFRERAVELRPPVRARLAAQVATRLADRLAPFEGEPEPALEELFRQESARRRGRFGAGRRLGADRFVAQKEARWSEFDRIARAVTARGLDALQARELPDFAARYREIAADLARARTYGAGPAAIARLERLVAAGHNALYRRERTTAGNVLRFLLRECPAAVVASWRYVALAAAVFILPGVAGYVVLRERPPLALEVLPDALLERAAAGAERTARGQGYFEAPPGERPLVASSIITNNVGVAFRCFAGGIFAGVGALVMLAFNGLMIGAASGHFANQGLLGYLWTFVAGHGVLELFAIWVAGAAGFLLGRALIAPGNLSRGDALVLSGRIGLRLVVAATLMLLVAGAIEGFISASGLPLSLRVAASAGSVVLLVVYLTTGLRTKDLGLRT
ncbi:MAG TPA: stage II sporulation protein M [Gemmatimonadales bacterium]